MEVGEIDPHFIRGSIQPVAIGKTAELGGRYRDIGQYVTG